MDEGERAFYRKMLINFLTMCNVKTVGGYELADEYNKVCDETTGFLDGKTIDELELAITLLRYDTELCSIKDFYFNAGNIMATMSVLYMFETRDSTCHNTAVARTKFLDLIKIKPINI